MASPTDGYTFVRPDRKATRAGRRPEGTGQLRGDDRKPVRLRGVCRGGHATEAVIRDQASLYREAALMLAFGWSRERVGAWYGVCEGTVGRWVSLYRAALGTAGPD